MSTNRFKPEVKEALDSILLEIPGVCAGKMFGLPGYYIEGKLFACVYREGVGIKVPANLAASLLERENVIPFQPFEKSKMLEWVQINHDQPGDYLADEEVFLASIEFVLELALGSNKKRPRGSRR